MIVALLFIVAAFMVFFDLLQPAYGDLQTKKGQQLNGQNLLANESTTVDQAKKLLSQYESVGQTGTDLALAMPSGPSVADALAQIYGIAQNSGVSIASVSASPPSTVQRQAQVSGTSTSISAAQIIRPLGMITFQLVASGSYENFKSFLAQMETNIRIFDVTALAVQTAPASSGGKGAGQDFFTYNMTIVTYYQAL